MAARLNELVCFRAVVIMYLYICWVGLGGLRAVDQRPSLRYISVFVFVYLYMCMCICIRVCVCIIVCREWTISPVCCVVELTLAWRFGYMLYAWLGVCFCICVFCICDSHFCVLNERGQVM